MIESIRKQPAQVDHKEFHTRLLGYHAEARKHITEAAGDKFFAVTVGLAGK